VSDLELRAGLWGRLEEGIAEEPEAEGAEEDGRGGLWDRLAELIDPAQFRPKLAPDVELKEFKLRWGNDYAMIANPRDLLHFRLTPTEAALVKLMDGTRTVKEIVLERLKESGDLELSGVADLVRELKVGNFLEQPFIDVEGYVQRAMNPITVRRQKAREFAKTLSVDWKNADRMVKWLYDHGLKWFFTKWAQVFSLAVTVGGIAAFVSLVQSKRFSLTGESLALGFLILLVLSYFSTFLHELGHAVVLTHYGRRVKSAGFMIYFGSPAFFVEASDGLMLERKQRMLQSFAGPYAEFLSAGITSIAAWAFPDAAITETLYKFSVLSYVVLFMNLVPLLELDGYWIFSDLIQVPDLRPQSISFVRHDFWHKLRARAKLSKQEWGLAAYGTAGVVFSIFSFYTAFFWWREIFGSLIARLWHGGLVTRLLLVALILAVIGPVVRGAINFVRALGRRLRALWSRIRFRLERTWRVEAATLIDALPIFDDVPEEALNELAGRVRLGTFARGQPVIRQGERAAAFYVVRRGTLQVVEENPETGNERVLRVLGRGESFGELGLTEAAPRSATVRALEEAEVFEIDKGTFDRLLADMVTVPKFAPTLQAAAELRELPCFAHLEPDELGELLQRGEWINLSPGEAVFEQGEAGDAFYAIRRGQVDVVQDGELQRTLGPGSFFGEIALLLDVARTATVVARTPVRAYRLDREGFDRLVRDSFKRGTLNPYISPDRTWQH
jgi:CRP-like cAMP-binding protein/Zn-dependent protease